MALWTQTFPIEEETKGEESVQASHEEDLLWRVSGLIRFIRAARMKRMLDFQADKAVLTEKFAGIFAPMASACPCQPFELLYSDLEKLVTTSDTRVVLETIPILEASAASGPIAPFEFGLASFFIKNCMVTAFPDTRQKMMKFICAFVSRVRTIYAKDIRRYNSSLGEADPAKDAELWAPLQPLYDFIHDVTTYAEENLYLDKPIEGAFPLFDVLKLIMDLFGGIDYRPNKAKYFEPINFLAKAKGGPLLGSKSLFMFLVNSLKSSWTNVRHNAFELLSKYADEYPEFHDPAFVNGILVPTAIDFLKDPRAMMAEASALMLKLVFAKCITVLDLGLLHKLSDGSDE